MLFHLTVLSFCLRVAARCNLGPIGMVQMVNIVHWNFCLIAVNKQTSAFSHLASSNAGLLDTCYCLSRSSRVPGFSSSTILYNWATVAPPNAITIVIQEVLKLCSTLTRLSPFVSTSSSTFAGLMTQLLSFVS